MAREGGKRPCRPARCPNLRWNRRSFACQRQMRTSYRTRRKRFGTSWRTITTPSPSWFEGIRGKGTHRLQTGQLGFLPASPDPTVRRFDCRCGGGTPHTTTSPAHLCRLHSYRTSFNIYVHCSPDSPLGSCLTFGIDCIPPALSLNHLRFLRSAALGPQLVAVCCKTSGPFLANLLVITGPMLLTRSTGY